MRRACPQCGRVMGDNGCDVHPRKAGRYGTRNPERDLVAHNRWARAIKRRDRYRCQGPGPHVGPLHAHHTHGIHDDRGITLCANCHKLVDSHAT